MPDVLSPLIEQDINWEPSMNLPTKIRIGCAFVCSILVFGLPMSALAATAPQTPKQVLVDSRPSSDPASIKLQILDAKVDLLEKVNQQILQSVYWTLATLAAIFLGLISVNLYFNVSANKREIEKIREDAEKLTTALIATAERGIAEKNEAATQAEIARVKEEIANLTTSLIKTSEASLVEKTTATTQREIEKSITAAKSAINNQLLTQRSEINATHEASARNIASALDSLKVLEIEVKELKIYKYSQGKQMGAIYGHIELLEYDMANRHWNLRYRLPEIREEIKGARLDVERATKLKQLLAQIKEPAFKDIVEEIGNSIVVKEPTPTT